MKLAGYLANLGERISLANSPSQRRQLQEVYSKVMIGRFEGMDALTDFQQKNFMPDPSHTAALVTIAKAMRPQEPA